MIKKIITSILVVLPGWAMAGLNDAPGLKLPMIQNSVSVKIIHPEPIQQHAGLLLTVSDWIVRYSMMAICLGLIVGGYVLWRMEHKDKPIDTDIKL